MFHKRTVYDIFKLKILMYFVVPIVLTAIIIVSNHHLNIQQYYNMYNEFYNNYTDEVFFNMEKEINTIVQMDHWLKNNDVKRVFDAGTDVTESEASIAIRHMRNMKNDFNIIDSILLINRKSGTVVATNGKADIERYFSDICKYTEYDAAYFKDIRYPVDASVKLPPTAIEGSDGNVRYVMPIVKMASVNENPGSFFVFNISLEKLLEARTTSKYTSNTSFWFVNKKDKQFYSGGKNVISIDEKIWNSIDLDVPVQNYEDANGEKYCVITKSVSPNLMDFAYLVFVPIKDVSRAVFGVTLKIILISILIYLLFAIIVLVLASDIGKFLGNLVKPLNFTEQIKMKEIFKVTDKISKEFSKILNENSSMKLEINSMMGDVKEKMITDVLNNKSRQVKMSLYKYDSFIPVIFRIIPKTEMDENVLSSIKEQLYSALRRCFDGMYEAYDITGGGEGVHFVLNIPHDIKVKSLKGEIEKLASIVSEKEINIEFEYYMGAISHSFEMLRDEYMTLRGKLNDKQARTADTKFMYRVSEHNSIINSILEGDYNKTIANIDRILITNVVNNVSSNDMNILYQNIINTVITAFKMKKIDVDKIVNDIGLDAYFNMGEMSETEITQFILKLINSIENSDNKNADEAIISDIVKFVGENYSDYSLTLESVAKEFNIDPKNLSRKFKKYSNMTFHKYLTELKIEEAKRLLITTDMSIEQIYTKVGYVSRTTFIRAFNSVEMVTPSEYRKNARG